MINQKFEPAGVARRWGRALLFSALLGGCAAGNLRGENDADDAGLRPLVIDLIGWIGQHSAYDVEALLDNLPEVSFCEPRDEIAYEGRSITMHEPVKGVYDLERARITLVKPWSEQDPKNVGTLLHELVHFVQYASRRWDCWHETELEAYRLHESWLRQQGIEPGFNWVEIFLLSRCSRRDIHP